MIQLASKALNPFQLLSHLVYTCKPFDNQITMIPISMDASSSAYQIMSLLLSNKDLALRTNLIKYDSEDRINDLYSSFMVELKEEILSSSLDASVKEAVCRYLNRKLIQKVYMPLVYGKSQHSASEDVIDFIIKQSSSFQVAGVLYQEPKVSSHCQINESSQPHWMVCWIHGNTCCFIQTG